MDPQNNYQSMLQQKLSRSEDSQIICLKGWQQKQSTGKFVSGKTIFENEGEIKTFPD